MRRDVDAPGPTNSVTHVDMVAHKIIFDTDADLEKPGVDDVIALLLLLASPEIRLEAITVTFGNSTLQNTFSNVLKVYGLVQQHILEHPHDATRFPNYARPTVLAKGRAGPIAGELHIAEYFHGPDGLSDISNTHPHFGAVTTHSSLTVATTEAYKVILDILEREPPGTVTILAAGPLTNIALALREQPEIVMKARRIVAMGGALDVPGNTSPVAEFNFYADPYAAQEVIQFPQLPLFLLPLDITVPHSVDFPILIPAHHDCSPSHTPLQSFITAILTRPRNVMRMLGEDDAFQMHDPLAAWFVIQHADIQGTALVPGWKAHRRMFRLERIGELTKGMCVVDRRGTREVFHSNRAESGVEEAVALRNLAQEGEDGIMVIVETPGVKELTDALLDRVILNSRAP
ncbi:nucleoside hydrolase [Dacryopinax primogenitus]|uniref:Nucleoside hydrolase n=1 Tax=Dacryopinax primogenitus (strain DJM 731) TaxID=1858805 RepID=M5FSR7_DACPD|nr:nucleoside hydrolase [Dacryopinax primogenitus]EJT98988.1 nucleoside hydrolase [Dacryopinax primogenitus]